MKYTFYLLLSNFVFSYSVFGILYKQYDKYLGGFFYLVNNDLASPSTKFLHLLAKCYNIKVYFGSLCSTFLDFYQTTGLLFFRVLAFLSSIYTISLHWLSLYNGKDLTQPCENTHQALDLLYNPYTDDKFWLFASHSLILYPEKIKKLYDEHRDLYITSLC